MTVERVISRADLRTDDVDVQLLLGQHAYEQGDLPTALEWWRAAADGGDHRAILTCGKATEETDPRAAADWYRRVTNEEGRIPGPWLFREARWRLECLIRRHPELAEPRSPGRGTGRRSPHPRP